MSTSIRYLLFDAVGTLIYPRPGVSEVYVEHGRRYGSRRTAEEIKERFGPALARSDREADAGRTSEAREYDRWRQIVAEVFDDVSDTSDLFAELWQYFATSQAWALYDDVVPTWEMLTQRGFRIGIASNFDARLRSVCAGHTTLARCEYLFISSELGFAKPHPGFFAEVLKRLDVPAEQLLFIGDDPRRDIAGAKQAGWQALLIDRIGGASIVSVLSAISLSPHLVPLGGDIARGCD